MSRISLQLGNGRWNLRLYSSTAVISSITSASMASGLVGRAPRTAAGDCFDSADFVPPFEALLRARLRSSATSWSGRTAGTEGFFGTFLRAAMAGCGAGARRGVRRGARIGRARGDSSTRAPFRGQKKLPGATVGLEPAGGAQHGLDARGVRLADHA